MLPSPVQIKCNVNNVSDGLGGSGVVKDFVLLIILGASQVGVLLTGWLEGLYIGFAEYDRLYVMLRTQLRRIDDQQLIWYGIRVIVELTIWMSTMAIVQEIVSKK